MSWPQFAQFSPAQALEAVHSPRRLRSWLLDEPGSSAPRELRDSAARMILYSGDLGQVLEVGLEFLCQALGASRCDVGFGNPSDQHFVSTSQYALKGEAILNVVGMPIPNRHAVPQAVWGSNRPLYFDLLTDARYADLRQVPALADSRTILVRRLELGGNAFGILCVDQTFDSVEWTAREQQLFDDFMLRFLSPLAFLHRRAAEAEQARPTQGELEVIRLAAQGLSYAEIATHLGKSPSTVNNQLASARQKLGVHNQVELIRACQPWL